MAVPQRPLGLAASHLAVLDRNGIPERSLDIRLSYHFDTGALVIFVTLQLLSRSGYASPPEGALQFTQSETVLQMIRLLVSPFGAVILCGTILLAWRFPLSREKYTRIQKLLEQRRARLAE